VSALRRVIANETVTLICRCISVAPTWPLADAAGALAAELDPMQAEPDVALSAAGRLVPLLYLG
jgi:hypothetical protein